MRRLVSTLTALVAVLAAAAPAAALVLDSTDVSWPKPVKKLFVWNKDGCTGRNQSPALNWDEVPARTASFALTVFDPDAPRPQGWVHWVRTGIPADARALARADAKTGVDGRNDFGATGYGGPCPPPGQRHRYVFTLYALDAGTPAFDVTTTYAALVAGMRGHTLATAQLVTRYKR